MIITLITGDISTERYTTDLSLAKAFHKKGHSVTLFSICHNKRILNNLKKSIHLSNGTVNIAGVSYSTEIYASETEQLPTLIIISEQIKTNDAENKLINTAIDAFASLEAVTLLDQTPQYLLTTGAETEIIPILLKFKYSHMPEYKHIKSYHYMNYRTMHSYNKKYIKRVLGIESIDADILTLSGEFNTTNAALISASRIFIGENASSILYDSGCLLHHTAIQFGFKIRKLIMGIDYSLYSPERDNYIYKKYTVESLDQKAKNKAMIQKCVGFDESEDIPLISLYTDKQTILSNETLKELCKNNIQLIISGNPRYTNDIPHNARYLGMINQKLIKNIFSASDFSIFTSLYSEYGNPAYIASAYGCIPIVPSLRFCDTGIEYFNKITREGNGYTYDPTTPRDVLYTLWDAIGVYRHDHHSYKRLVHNTMNKVFPISDSADIIEKESEKTLLFN